MQIKEWCECMHKIYNLDKDNFLFYVQECKVCLNLLGIHRAPVTFAFELPPQADKFHLGGSIMYEDSQKILIYLNPEWPREVTDNKLKYLAAHEAVEILLIDKFLAFCEECVRVGHVDYKKWEDVSHNALNRLLMLYDPELLIDVAEGPVFEEA